MLTVRVHGFANNDHTHDVTPNAVRAQISVERYDETPITMRRDDLFDELLYPSRARAYNLSRCLADPIKKLHLPQHDFRKAL